MQSHEARYQIKLNPISRGAILAATEEAYQKRSLDKIKYLHLQ